MRVQNLQTERARRKAAAEAKAKNAEQEAKHAERAAALHAAARAAYATVRHRWSRSAGQPQP